MCRRLITSHRSWLLALAVVAAACSSGADIPGARTPTPAPTPATPPTRPPTVEETVTTALPTGTPTTDATSSPTATATTAPPDGPAAGLAADEAVALGFSQDFAGVGIIDVTTGELVRELQASVGEGASSLDHVPGRDAVLFSRVVTAASSEVVEVPLDGGEARVLEPGYAVDATDDGSLVAVARLDLQEGRDERITLEVRDDDGVVATWTASSTPELPARPANLAWSEDGGMLAFDVRFEDGTSVFTIDLAEAPAQGDLYDVARPIQPGEQRGAMSSRPFWLPDGSFGVVQACCGLLELDTWSAVLVDHERQVVTDTLFEVDRGIGPVDVRHDEARMLLVLTHDALGSDEEPGPNALMRWDGDQPAPVADELLDAAW